MPLSPPFVIPLFLPHRGCPHRCVFCNQHSITGGAGATMTPETVRQIITSWIDRPHRQDREVQVAFYGGSFTALPWEEQEELLDVAAPFLKSGAVQAIRLSTRPDCVDADLIARLTGKGVRIVELGVQSMDDRVLARCRRGHSAAASERAVALLKEGGVVTGVQLMVGLPGESRPQLMRGVRRILRLRPDFVRIYPTVVVEGSALADDYRRGRYRPLSLSMAVLLAAWMKRAFAEAAIPVVRMGLQDSNALSGSVVAGPHHPAFGELVAGRIAFRQTRRLLRGVEGRPCSLLVSGRDTSVFLGNRRANIRRLAALGLLDRVEVLFDNDLPRGEMRLQARGDIP